MLKIILSALAMLALVSLPLLIIYHRVKHGNKNVRKPMIANIAMFCTVFAACAVVFLTQGAAAVSDGSLVTSDGFAKGMGYLSAAIAVSVSGIAGGKAVSSSASAAIGALAENEGTFGKALVFVGMAEGIALYGMLVAFIIISNL